MSDNEYERFEISDYDLQNEFNINRPRRRQTKNQQIYGIWADDSDADSEEDMSGRRRGKKQKDYSAPVSFVTGGIQQAGKKHEENQDQEDGSQITDDEEDRPSLGKSQKALHYDSDSSEDDSASMTVNKSWNKLSSNTTSRQPNMASWERHTKGIGAKLLLQMGYKPGMGLGKDLQGISEPVEAHIRKGRGAIGAYGPEKPATVGGKKTEIIIDEDIKEEKEFKEKLNKWKKDEKTRKDKKKRYYYESVEDIIEKGKKSSVGMSEKLSKLSNVTVIDMTGPEKRVLSSYRALHHSKISDDDIYAHPTNKESVNFSVPELMHNLNLIVDLCEQDIIAIDKTRRENSDRQKQLEREKESLEKVVRLEQNHIQTLEQTSILVEELINDSNLSLERAEKIFITLQKDFAAEYQELGLEDLAAGVVAPLVKKKLESWNPLGEPTKFVETIKKWRSILQIRQTETRNVFDPYSSLIWVGIIPNFRSTASEWNPKVHQHMAALLDTWAPLFPTWILDNVLDQLILSRLVLAVNEWDPLTDTIPIHIWILPWSNILGKKMEENIYPTIRRKLGNALQAWTPQDRSARAMLTPWKNAFDEGEMQGFLLKHIIPKLQMSLNELVINPLQQDIELWNQVWEWNEVIPPLLMAQLLDKYFFPKWMQTLVIWLNQSPDFDQISRWYTGWKSLLSEIILQQPAIKEHFRRALEIMHRATETPQPVPLPQLNPTSVNIQQTHPPALMDLQIPPPSLLDFKEIVLKRCADQGIICAPMPGRRHLGKQVYRCGKLFCYFEKNVLMVSRDGSFTTWTPTSLGLLLIEAAN